MHGCSLVPLFLPTTCNHLLCVSYLLHLISSLALPTVANSLHAETDAVSPNFIGVFKTLGAFQSKKSGLVHTVACSFTVYFFTLYTPFTDTPMIKVRCLLLHFSCPVLSTSSLSSTCCLLHYPLHCLLTLSFYTVLSPVT